MKIELKILFCNLWLCLITSNQRSFETSGITTQYKKNKNEGINMNLNQIKTDKTLLNDENLDSQIVSSQRY